MLFFRFNCFRKLQTVNYPMNYPMILVLIGSMLVVHIQQYNRDQRFSIKQIFYCQYVRKTLPNGTIKKITDLISNITVVNSESVKQVV